MLPPPPPAYPAPGFTGPPVPVGPLPLAPVLLGGCGVLSTTPGRPTPPQLWAFHDSFHDGHLPYGDDLLDASLALHLASTPPHIGGILGPPGSSDPGLVPPAHSADVLLAGQLAGAHVASFDKQAVGLLPQQRAASPECSFNSSGSCGAGASCSTGSTAGAFLLRLVKDDAIQHTPGTSTATCSSDSACILEASTHSDGKQYVEINGRWEKASARYYCLCCKVFGNLMQAHLESGHHRKNKQMWESSLHPTNGDSFVPWSSSSDPPFTGRHTEDDRKRKDWASWPDADRWEHWDAAEQWQGWDPAKSSAGGQTDERWDVVGERQRQDLPQQEMLGMDCGILQVRASADGALAGQSKECDENWDDWDRNAEWAERNADGSWRCIPCGKMIDKIHLRTEAHKSKVEDFWWNRKPLKERYPDPPEEWLAWVPADERDPDQKRWLRCLLCEKWVNGGCAHSEKGGSKEHQQRMETYYWTRSDWYLKNVVPLRKKWSTNTGVAGLGAAAHSPCMETPPQPPHPWQIAWSEEHKAFYYWNTSTNTVQWNPP